jgi:hypothetical protein
MTTEPKPYSPKSGHFCCKAADLSLGIHALQGGVTILIFLQVLPIAQEVT